MEGFFVCLERKGKRLRGALVPQQPGRQQPLAVAVREAVVRLDVGLGTETPDDASAAPEMSLQAAYLHGAGTGHIAEIHAVVRSQIAEASVGERSFRDD